jgi:hypothetical protein
LTPDNLADLETPDAVLRAARWNRVATAKLRWTKPSIAEAYRAMAALGFRARNACWHNRSSRARSKALLREDSGGQLGSAVAGLSVSAVLAQTWPLRGDTTTARRSTRCKMCPTSGLSSDVPLKRTGMAEYTRDTLPSNRLYASTEARMTEAE